MKKTICQDNTERRLKWLGIFFLVLTFCLLSIDITYAQPQSPGKKMKTNSRTFMHHKRVPHQQGNNSSCNQNLNRSYDGTCNNITNMRTDWGATDIALFRELPAAYSAPDFYNDMGGTGRLSARAISNLICSQGTDIPSPRNLSSFVFTWGQFIDHDIDLTPEGHTEYVPILLSSDEPDFTSPIPFFRSEVDEGTGITSDRQQQNIITSWLDGSTVYGSEESRAKWLRTFQHGKLKTSPGNLLPYNTIDGSKNSDIDPDAPSMAGDESGTLKVFVAGDVRANEQPGLTALHTLFVREHNRLCEMMVSNGQTNDEKNYQRARKRVGAYIQAITYNDFLPALGVMINPYSGYDPNVKPNISNIFATAAYRLGHTMVTSEIPVLNLNCSPNGSGSISLLESFFNPDIIPEYGLESILLGLSTQTQQKVDPLMVDDLRNFLFVIPGNPDPFGLDLASLNIQRGRDHGLPNYQVVCAYYTGLFVTSLADITDNTEVQEKLKAAFGNIYDIDLWVGLLSEDPIPGSSIGPTLNAILSHQFEKIRDGDFYFYRHDPAFTPQQRANIDGTDLTDIIKRNTPINKLQNNIFFAASCGTNGNDNLGGGQGGLPRVNEDGNNSLNGTTGVLKVFPNPSSGKVNLNVVFSQPGEEVVIQVFDPTGQVWFQNSTNLEIDQLSTMLDLSHLPGGMYFISVKSGGDQYSKRVMIQ